ncbi:hypothetical protein FA13DRAFT_1396605 [Coprinellus micaceus]|uniref:Uncharacterized protein n=1 Tax=Coprinellus micaceus TaxID=71717 RepID=A0A4Y7SQL6_COPMI|nr:hypothetical protein FA13DRAFT_699422 [Coprinellus micaceus]TEB23948.1 hypothetical protein FA13DRAFT_1396605 [Coprinellus micaceus]
MKSKRCSGSAACPSKRTRIRSASLPSVRVPSFPITSRGILISPPQRWPDFTFKHVDDPLSTQPARPSDSIPTSAGFLPTPWSIPLPIPVPWLLSTWRATCALSAALGCRSTVPRRNRLVMKTASQVNVEPLHS